MPVLCANVPGTCHLLNTIPLKLHLSADVSAGSSADLHDACKAAAAAAVICRVCCSSDCSYSCVGLPNIHLSVSDSFTSMEQLGLRLACCEPLAPLHNMDNRLDTSTSTCVRGGTALNRHTNAHGPCRWICSSVQNHQNVQLAPATVFSCLSKMRVCHAPCEASYCACCHACVLRAAHCCAHGDQPIKPGQVRSQRRLPDHARFITYATLATVGHALGTACGEWLVECA